MKDLVILFDFFGVVGVEIAPTWLMKHLPKEEALEIKDQIFQRADRGDIDEMEAFTELSKYSNQDPLEVKAEWEEAIKIDSEVVEYLKELRKDHKVYLLSNAIGSMLHRILDNNNLNELFDKKFISSEIALIKPNTDFFNYVINDLSIDAQSAVMIDDNPENIEGAKATGLKGIVYRGVDDLREQIKKLEG